MDFQYTLDGSGHRTRIEEHSGRITDYIYDDLYRFTNEDITDLINGNYSATYDYDNVGNRTGSTINGVSTIYSYDDNDRLTQQGGETYGYDDNGNTTSKTIDNETSTYRYDVKNQLNRATLINGGIISNTSYRYDIDGIRIQKTENTNTIDYLVDHNRDYAQVLKETNQTTSQGLDYLYGDDLINQSQGNTNEKYYLYDGLGSTRQLTDDTGTTTDSYDYEAFGSTLNQTGTSQNNYLFTGEQYDHTLDQQYLRARYYNPDIGRFTQQDSWMGRNRDPITLHKYLYAHADPVNNIDPTGHFTLGSVSAANTIRGELTALQLDIGLNLFDSIVDPESTAKGPDITAIGLGAIGGTASFKLLKMLSSKFRKACNSFDADTKVWTEEGLQFITDIEIGDKVWAFDEHSGDIQLQDIVHLIQREGDYKLLQITINDETIDTTENHPFYVKTEKGWEWLDASDLKVGDHVLDKDGQEQSIAGITQKSHWGKVYNLTVNNDHTYLVGESGVVAHNAGRCKVSGIVYGAKKPRLELNPKHKPGGRGYNPKAGTLPVDSDIAFKNNAVFDGRHWWAQGSNKALYRYSKTSEGVFHWSGSSKDVLVPLTRKNKPPKEILKYFGISLKGKL